MRDFSKLPFPAALRELELPDLHELAEDIRQAILSTCLKNGGHLGASLGAVELAIALHREFESPLEPIVWDVGHQAYAHKLLTGRWARFNTLRRTGGISGFLSRDESEHDVFGAGHSSTALSAALAMAWARGHEKSTRWTVAVVGDGGLTAGVALEAIQNAHALPMGPLLVVLNDNQMSISPNVGSLPGILASGGAADFFMQFGFDYLGPVNGNDTAILLETIARVKEGYSNRPVLLHVLTQKGKGYIPAEESPATYHGVSPVQAKVPESGRKPPGRSYSEAMGSALCKLAESDPRIVAITAAMPEGTGLTEFSRKFPDRFFDVGIAEPHAVTFAAGLATQGFRPVVAIYSTFLQRGIDAIIHDVALQRLPVIFAVDRAGLVGADGPTHHGAFDISYLKMIPGMRIFCPASLEDIGELLGEALKSGEPCAIRFPRGIGPEELEVPADEFLRCHQMADAPELITVGLGAMSSRVAEAAKEADPEVRRITALSVIQAKPLPQELLDHLNQNPRAQLMVVEEGSLMGGFGETLVAALRPRAVPVTHVGLPDEFIPHGSIGDLEERVGLSQAAILKKMQTLIG